MEITKNEVDFVAESIVKEELILEDEWVTSEAGDDLLQEKPQSKSSTFLCEICSKSFSTRRNLKSHIRVHKPSSIPCSICGKTFKEQYLLERHLRAHERYNKPKEYRCQHCDQVFEIVTLYKIHLKSHSSNPYLCSVCGKSFSQRNLLRKHEEFAHNIPRPPVPDEPNEPDRPNYCNVCDKTLKSRKIFVNHMRRHKYVQEGVFRCIPCNKPFGDHHSMLLHENRHHVKGNAKLVELHCELCSEVFCSQTPYSDLRRHQRNVHNAMHGIISGTMRRGTEDQGGPAKTIKNEPKEAETAESIEQNETFYGESIVKEELIIEDDFNAGEEETPTLHCTECDKSFSTDRQYYLHQRRHRKRDFSCDICQKSFREKFELERHVRIHRVLSNKCVDREFHCAECDKTFSMETLFKCHMKRHGEPIYKCSVCPKAFPIKSDLSKHEKNIHQIASEGVAADQEPDSADAADSKLYCKECDKYFRQRKTYLTHVRRHRRLKEGTYTCEPCGKTFCNKFTLSLHQNGIQHKNNVKDPARCDVCQMVFPSKRKLARHKKELHSAPSSVNGECQPENAVNVTQQVEIKVEPDETSS